jgi:hypothetical protein
MQIIENQQIEHDKKTVGESIIWMAKRERNLASIANKKWVTNFDRFMGTQLGIFGRFEQPIGEVVFINPYMIWHVRQKL